MDMDEDMLKKISLSIRERLAELPAQTSFPEPVTEAVRYFMTLGMNDYGLRYLDLFLRRRRRNETIVVVVDRLVMAMGNNNLLGASQFNTRISERLLDYYKSEYTVTERLFKSCFVVELFRKYAMKKLRGADDPIFNTPQKLHKVRSVLVSIDHQIPFCFLVEFFNVTKNPDDRPDNLIDLALLFFENMVGHPLKACDNLRIQIIKHPLHLVHDALCPLPLAETSTSITTEMDVELQFINYATELREAGIRFKKMKGKNLLDINFKNGVLEIPPLKVADNTLYLLQNLMKYEKQLPVSVRRNVNDYAKFIQCLVNSPKDVELLRRSGIIENWLGNDEVILKRLNDLGTEAEISGSFTYSEILKQVNEHCGRRRNIWMANLWRNYFNSPWSFISFVAAVVLLLLTLTQTVFSIISYPPRKL